MSETDLISVSDNPTRKLKEQLLKAIMDVGSSA